MKNFAKLAISILLLFTLPTAMGTFEIQQGPSALAASPGATAWGGNILITDPAGNAQDGNYFALMGLNAIAFIPGGTEGSAYANFYNHDGKFERTQEILAGQGKGSTVKFNMAYTGSAGANVEKTRPNGPALAFGAIGSAVGDFATTPQGWVPGAEAGTDTAAGASGMMAVLVLPDRAVGNSGAAGAAGYNIAKVGKTVMAPGLTSDEVLEVYGNSLGQAVITGPGQLVNGAAAAQNQVLGVAALGTASFATDFYGNQFVEGQGLTASGMLSLAGATGNSAARPSRIETIAEGTTDGGFWDGATPLGTNKRVGVNENGMTQTTGKVSSKAEAYLNNDIAASHSILANIAFHSNSPLWLDPEMTGTVEKIPGMIAPEMKTQNKDGIGDVCGAYEYLFETLETVATCHCDEENFDSILDEVGADNKEAIMQYIPQTSEELCAGDDPIVALNLALTAAAASRQQQGSLTSPILTAESYIDTDSVAQATHDGDRAVVSKMDDASLGSGAHLRSMPGNYASTGFGIQAAGQAWPATGYPTVQGNLAVYGAITQGPPYNGDRWNDAGSYVRFEEGMMESSKGTSYYRTTNGPLGPEGAITWIEGGDLNPQIRGQDYNSLFEDSVSGLPQLTLKTDNLGYLEFPQNRDTAWVSATVHGGI